MMPLTNYIKLTRLNQPVGILLLFLPCLFGVFLSLKNLPNFFFLESLGIIGLFLAGSIIMRSAGCIINDLTDQKFDEKVERTKSRPLAAKKISRRSAFILLGFLLFFGLLILVQFNAATILSGFVAMALVITYPFMKRITHYPQIFLGLTFNFGVLMASLALLESINFNTIILYVACIIWTIIYDTIYAYQDIEDDLKIGVKSTAIKFQNNPKKALTFLNFLLFLLLVFLGWKANFESGFFLAILVADLLLNHKIKNCDFSDSQKCLKVFKANIWVGALILTAIILG
jgi:4-hydroxybenzoate polyprenyltransferase